MSDFETNLFSAVNVPHGTEDGTPDNQYYNIEYEPGMSIPLEVVDSLHGEFDQVYQVEATVEHIFTPSTQSVVMLVSFVLHQGQPPRTTILKLFDRRGAKGYRTANNNVVDKWNREFEQQYQQWIASDFDGQIKDAAVEFVEDHHNESFFGVHDAVLDDEPETEDFFREALFALGCKYMMDREVEVYEALGPLQGSVVPDLYCTVVYTPPGAMIDDEFSSVHGLLLEYADGIQLCQLSSSDIAAGDHQRIGDLAIEAINSISACNVLNCDVSSRNAVVRRASDNLEWQVVVYDFGIARVREQDEDDDRWLELKWKLMEVDKMGLELVDLANYEYDCVKPYDDDELQQGSDEMHQQQEVYKQQFFNSWRQQHLLVC